MSASTTSDPIDFERIIAGQIVRGEPDNIGDFTAVIEARLAVAVAHSGRTDADIARDVGMTKRQLRATLRGKRGLFVHELIFLSLSLHLDIQDLLADAEAGL